MRIETIRTTLPIGHLDSGLDGNHPLLHGKVASFQEIDQDGSIYQAEQAYDLDEHGTTTAQLIVEQCPEVTFHSVAMPQQGKVVLNILKGLNELLKSPAKVVCLALGIPAPDPIFRPLIEAFEKKGVLLVAAIGNAGPNKGLAPASCTEVLAVGATDHKDRPASFSATRLGKPDVLAPGTAIETYASDGRSIISQGTSMAAARVAGIAARLWQEFPEASHVLIREAFRKSAEEHPHRLIFPGPVRNWLENYDGKSLSSNPKQSTFKSTFIDPRFSLHFETSPDWVALEALVMLYPSYDPRSVFHKLENLTASTIEFCEPLFEGSIIHLKAKRPFFHFLLKNEVLSMCHALDIGIIP